MASFSPATTSLPTRESLCLSPAVLASALGIFQRLHKLPGGFLVGRSHIRLFVLGVDRQHIDFAVAKPVVVDDSYATALALAFAPPARLTNAPGARNDWMGLGIGSKRAFHSGYLRFRQQPFRLTLVPTGGRSEEHMSEL